MGVVALKAEPMADCGVFAFVILTDNLFMTLSTINHPQALGMGNIFNIVMAIDTAQITVDRRKKLFMIYKECKLAFVHLLLFRSRKPGGLLPNLRCCRIDRALL